MTERASSPLASYATVVALPLLVLRFAVVPRRHQLSGGTRN